jgi:hypothetical protein
MLVVRFRVFTERNEKRVRITVQIVPSDFLGYLPASSQVILPFCPSTSSPKDGDGMFLRNAGFSRHLYTSLQLEDHHRQARGCTHSVTVLVHLSEFDICEWRGIPHPVTYVRSKVAFRAIPLQVTGPAHYRSIVGQIYFTGILPFV